MISAVAITLYFPVDLTFVFKLVAVGIPLSVPLVVALLLALWKRNRGHDGPSAGFIPRTITALVTFEIGILASLTWLAVHDGNINRANAVRYKEASCRIELGMTKGEIIEAAGSPDNMNRGKDGEELWWWQSHHRWEHPIAFKVIGKPAFQGGPYLRIAFDSSERVARVEANSAWR